MHYQCPTPYRCTTYALYTMYDLCPINALFMPFALLMICALQMPYMYLSMHYLPRVSETISVCVEGSASACEEGSA
jgi:hypothetical protein